MVAFVMIMYICKGCVVFESAWVSIASNKDTDMTNNVRRFDKLLVSSLMNVYIPFRHVRVCMDVCVKMHTYALTKHAGQKMFTSLNAKEVGWADIMHAKML